MGKLVYQSQVLSSGLTLATAAVDLGIGYKRVFLGLATATSGSHYIQCDPMSSTVFKRVAGIHQTMNVAAHFAINSNISGCFVEVPAIGRWAKVENSSGTTDTHTTYYWITEY